MKYLYQCGKCGKTYEDMDDAWKCESSHAYINTWCRFDNELSKFTQWKTGDVMPRTLAFQSQQVFDEGEGKTYYGLYEFKRHLTDAEIAQITEEYKANHPEEQE